MATVERLYATEVRKKFGGFHGNWLPDTPIKLGDLGVLKSGLFRSGVFCTVGTLEKLGISLGETRTGNWQAFEYSSSSSVKIDFKVAGKANPALPAIPLEEAGIGFEFGNAGAFAIIAQKQRTVTLVDINAIGQQLEPLLCSGKADRKTLVVTGVLQTQNTQLLISQDGKSKIQMSIKGVSSPTIAALGKGSISYTVVSEHKRIMKISNAGIITPFIRLHWFSTAGRPTIYKALDIKSQIPTYKLVELTDIVPYEQAIDKKVTSNKPNGL